MKKVSEMSEELRLFGNTEHDPRSPLYKGPEPDETTDECEFCNGTGKAQESCCGMPLNDYGICSARGCGEHTYVLGDSCEECNGTGKVTN